MPIPIQADFLEPAESLGPGHPLVEQLGSAGKLWAASWAFALLENRPTTGVRAFRKLLSSYENEVLIPIELPAIQRAYEHARGNQLRELIRFDRELGTDPVVKRVGESSRRVGRLQLRRLRPLKDVRFVQRYLGAVEREQAHAWHTLVYGLTMSLFSLPLNQGLYGYCRQVLRGFIYAAASPLGLSDIQCLALLDERYAGLPRPSTLWLPPAK